MKIFKCSGIGSISATAPKLQMVQKINPPVSVSVDFESQTRKQQYLVNSSVCWKQISRLPPTTTKNYRRKPAPEYSLFYEFPAKMEIKWSRCRLENVSNMKQNIFISTITLLSFFTIVDSFQCNTQWVLPCSVEGPQTHHGQCSSSLYFHSCCHPPYQHFHVNFPVWERKGLSDSCGCFPRR